MKSSTTRRNRKPATTITLLSVNLVFTLAVTLHGQQADEQTLRKLDSLVTDSKTQETPAKAQSQSGSDLKQFFEPSYAGDAAGLQDKIDEMQRKVDALNLRLDKVENQTSINRLRREIKRLTQGPDEVSEITLQNGTVVVGKIIAENLDRIIVQTPIGQLTLDRTTIKGVSAQEKPHALVELNGGYEERNYPEKRAYTGQVINKGLRRADFVRVVFRLHDSKTNIIAQDSTFISGEQVSYLSGVVSESALSPNQKGSFYLEVLLPSGVDSRNISYVTYKVRFDEFD
ncbi:MAG: hypothetical protein K9N11_09820 [Lentisphaeria bacterium]|nr:hypothetical protein [Candidatus Neomarinimicrobiota bacterium]MCF7843130.1 hypothetical protein [Lentisphaeria bacterium]